MGQKPNQQTPSPSRRSTQHRPHGHSPIRVLVVDDERRMREFARAILEEDREVSVVGEAENGRAATSMARELSPDVIVMDISMPVMNGLEAAQTILRDSPRCRIIITTAMGGDPYRRVSLAIGAAAFLDKPSLDAELLSTVHTTVDHGPH